MYDWALSQPLHPVRTSEFIRKVQDFHTYAIAREGDGWRVRGAGQLRTLRMPYSVNDITPHSPKVLAWQA